MPPVTWPIDFSLFPDNTTLGPRFTLGGYHFGDLGSSAPSFINVSGPIKGLQFPRDGLLVRLPLERDLVEVRAAAFATLVAIEAKDSAGNNVYSVTIPADKQVHEVRLAHPGIAYVEFKEGNNEGNLVSISIEACE